MIYHCTMITKGYQPDKWHNYYYKEKTFFLPSLENTHFTKTLNLSKISLKALLPSLSLCRFRIIFGQKMIFMINKQISMIRPTLLPMKVNNRIFWIEDFSANRILNSTISYYCWQAMYKSKTSNNSTTRFTSSPRGIPDIYTLYVYMKLFLEPTFSECLMQSILSGFTHD